MTKKNILIIYADQWRPDQFGAPVSYTPNLDALAAEAVSFDAHYAQAIPCAPSRACHYTGLMPQTHGVMANRMPLDTRHVTIAQYLRKFDYAPTLFGYTDTTLDPRQLAPGDPQLSGYQPLPGCDIGCHQPEDNPAEWMAHLRARGVPFTNSDDIYDPDLTRPNATGGAAGHPAKYRAEDSDTAFLTDRLLDWHSAQPPGWCAMLNFLRPHNPTIAPEPWNSAVDPASLCAPIRAETPEAAAAQHPYMAALLGDGDASDKCAPGLSGRVADVAEVDWRSIRAIHLALMAELDAHVGRVFEQIKAMGQWEDTLILFSSDHSEVMFDHYLCNQAAWHDQSVKIPLILRLPGEAETRRVADFTGSVDIVPTLLDWLGAECPGHLDGRSLLPLARGKTPADWRQSITWEFYFRSFQSLAKAHGLSMQDRMMSVYRDRQFKHVYMPGLPPVLVDLTADPGELRNVASEPAYAAIERRYLDLQLQVMIRHRDRSLDPLV
ncbi:MAG: sulfatase-like hydrolase/transferase [Pelagimonas sp.]|jgi:arylsulfatase A-like enzyme|nr:sulfatase-like hydrolase/transferase [Pelagimonas sp.]